MIYLATSLLKDDQINSEHYAGLEVGAVSVKFVSRTPDGATKSEIKRHGGNPNDIIQTILNKYRDQNDG